MYAVVVVLLHVAFGDDKISERNESWNASLEIQVRGTRVSRRLVTERAQRISVSA